MLALRLPKDLEDYYLAEERMRNDSGACTPLGQVMAK